MPMRNAVACYLLLAAAADQLRQHFVSVVGRCGI